MVDIMAVILFSFQTGWGVVGCGGFRYLYEDQETPMVMFTTHGHTRARTHRCSVGFGHPLSLGAVVGGGGRESTSWGLGALSTCWGASLGKGVGPRPANVWSLDQLRCRASTCCVGPQPAEASTSWEPQMAEV